MCVSQLQAVGAQEAANVLQNLLEIPAKGHYRRFIRPVLTMLAKETDKIPSKLFITSVEADEWNESNIIMGGFGVVHSGLYKGQPVALKWVRVTSRGDKRAKIQLEKSLYREALTWLNLRHQYILPCLGISRETKPSNCIVSPWMAGGDLRTFITGDCDLTVIKMLISSWLRQIAIGVLYLHMENIAHGDLRCVNVLLDPKNSTICVADFGLAVFADNISQANDSERGGNPNWLAPELNPSLGGLNSSTRPTYQGDIYSYGCVIIELFTQANPSLLISIAVYNEKPLDKEEICGRTSIPIPDGFWSLAKACWFKEPSQRHPMLLLVQTLDQIGTQNLQDFSIGSEHAATIYLEDTAAPSDEAIFNIRVYLGKLPTQVGSLQVDELKLYWHVTQEMHRYIFLKAYALAEDINLIIAAFRTLLELTPGLLETEFWLKTLHREIIWHRKLVQRERDRCVAVTNDFERLFDKIPLISRKWTEIWLGPTKRNYPSPRNHEDSLVKIRLRKIILTVQALVRFRQRKPAKPSTPTVSGPVIIDLETTPPEGSFGHFDRKWRAAASFWKEVSDVLEHVLASLDDALAFSADLDLSPDGGFVDDLQPILGTYAPLLVVLKRYCDRVRH
ncbi:unnamed protein product [Somion occarium]|uniref:Protein kinase domain-containing protein n=1 Tax=Somion occarium TaxID=3059160 RepID=A0ABP1E7M6_9APHY